jgi:hypothetical protein
MIGKLTVVWKSHRALGHTEKSAGANQKGAPSLGQSEFGDGGDPMVNPIWK